MKKYRSKKKVILLDILSRIDKRIIKIFLLLLFLFTFAHFLYSGVKMPTLFLDRESPYNHFLQWEEEVKPLMENIDNVKQIEITNTRQYGPVQFFIAYPILKIFDNDIYWLEFFALIFAYAFSFMSFYICYLMFIKNNSRLQKRWNKFSMKNILLLVLMLAVWFNFAPLYYIMTTKNVEIIELFFILASLMFYQNRKLASAGISMAIATLLKFLPGIFLFYYFIKSKKTFLYSILSIIGIILFATITFNSSVGINMVPRIFNQAGLDSWAILHFENVALKGLIFKAMGGFHLDKSKDVFFSISDNLILPAQILTLLFQVFGIILIFIIILKMKRIKSSYSSIERYWIEFSIVLTIMLLISPATAKEYSLLLLPAYTAALYFILVKPLDYRLISLFSVSYLLVGNFFPVKYFIRLIPISTMNIIFGNEATVLSNIEMFKGYCFPTMGYILLLTFFIYMIYNKSYLKSNQVE